MRLIRVMCSGRIDLSHILRAFAKGADGVFIGGCRLGECNYITHGNYHALNLVSLSKKILEHIGLKPERLQISFMSGGEGNLFAAVMDDFSRAIRDLGPVGSAGEISRSDMQDAVADVSKLVPYIKIEKHAKLVRRLDDVADYDDHFSLDEVSRLFSEVKSYYIDPQKCQACMICARSCPVDAIEGGKSLIHVIDQDKCIKCGTCLKSCPSRFGAITEISGGSVPEPLAPEKRKIVRSDNKKIIEKIRRE